MRPLAVRGGQEGSPSEPGHEPPHPPQVERVTQPLLQHQYELHMAQLEQSCERRPLEHVLYHGTTARAIRDICEQGFNRSFCGRNGEELQECVGPTEAGPGVPTLPAPTHPCLP